MKPLDSLLVVPAASKETIHANIARNMQRGLGEIFKLPEWRELMPMAVVGGGPSLAENLDELRKFENIMACGSVHDYLISQGIIPKWSVQLDPDPITANYIRKPHKDCTYLVSSQCGPEVFDALQGQRIFLWHCGGIDDQNEVFDKYKTILMGGGCTVGTRAIVISVAFGFSNIHLFGFDNCVRENGDHHSYEFSDPSEKLDELIPVRFELEGKEFKMAGYMLGQLFDFKKLLKLLAARIQVTIHGNGALAELMRLGKAAVKEKQDGHKT